MTSSPVWNQFLLLGSFHKLMITERGCPEFLKRDNLFSESPRIAVKLAQSVQRSLSVCKVASSSPVRSNALVKIECA